MRFRIEYIAQRERPAYLFARQLEAGPFTACATSRLGGVPIKPKDALWFERIDLEQTITVTP